MFNLVSAIAVRGPAELGCAGNEPRLPRRTTSLATALLLAVAATLPRLALHAADSPAPAPKPVDDLSWMRGANYVPSYSRNDVQTWMDYDPAVVDRELGYAERLKLNTVRVFLQQAVFEKQPEKFMADFESFLGLCDKHGIKMMPVLFDSCFDPQAVDLKAYRDKNWMPSPGFKRLGAEDWPAMVDFIHAVVGKYKNDRRIVLWDVMNEPESTGEFGKSEGRARIVDFLRRALTQVRAQGATQPLSIGWAGTGQTKVAADLSDVIIIHNYAKPEGLADDIRRIKELGKSLNKPVIINEFVGRPQQPIELAIPVVAKERIGWCFWELMIGRTQFAQGPQPYQGHIYPDGTCYDAREVAAIMGVNVAEALKAFPQRRWTTDEAWAWFKKQLWIVGFNYVPSTAANTTEFWAAETFDEKTMDRELGWAQGLGFNTTRVFIQYLVWKDDPGEFKKRFERFLALSAQHGISVMPVLFDDCNFGDPKLFDPFLGKQREPIPGMILPSWTPSPGRKLGNDPAERPALKRYVQDLLATFGKDQRVIAWDLYNEPMGPVEVGQPALLEEIFTWAGAVRPDQPFTMGVWNDNKAINPIMLARSDVISFHRYAQYAGLQQYIGGLKKHGRPLICTEWMARAVGSKWDTDLPLFKQEAVGCYSWGLVNGRTQCQFGWDNKRGTPEPKVWFHDLFHRDGQPYDSAEQEVIRKTTADKTIDWSAADYSKPSGAGPRPRMFFGDATRHGRPFAKDPTLLRLGERYLMYYSMAPSTNQALPKGWAIGIAESRDLLQWKKVGEILPEQPCEQNGLVTGKALLLGGKVHLFYNSYGNGKNDALCHATSDDGLKFARDPSNPILRPTGDWNSGRAIDCDAFEFGSKLWLIYATRDPSMKTQLLVAATADLQSDFGRAAWTPVGNGPILKPELPWETRCIEAPSVIQRSNTLYLFYGGGYNNDPQQIGCATSTDGLHWTRLFREPLIPNGQPGDWNASETGHPGVFADTDGRTYLFVQGNNDKGRTWFLSAYEIAWQDERPAVVWDSAKFPMKRPGPAAHSEGGINYSAGWTCWRGHGPRGDGLHYANTAGATATWESSGSKVVLVHKLGPDCGLARVLIDGQPADPAEFDTYSPSVEWGHRRVLATNLPPGRHTVTIVTLGKKNEKSSDSYVQIVDFEKAEQ